MLRLQRHKVRYPLNARRGVARYAPTAMLTSDGRGVLQYAPTAWQAAKMNGHSAGGVKLLILYGEISKMLHFFPISRRTEKIFEVNLADQKRAKNRNRNAAILTAIVRTRKIGDCPYFHQLIEN